MQDEENLARRAQQRDPEAFSQLYDKHFDKIYRYLSRSRGRVKSHLLIGVVVILGVVRSR